MAKNSTLFAYTRKRVFDSIMARFTGFTVKDIDTSIPAMTFKYFGNVNMRIFEDANTGAVEMLRWIDGHSQRQYSVYDTRSAVNAILTEVFSAWPETNGNRVIRRSNAKR